MSQLLVEPIKQVVKQLKPSQILRQTTMTQHFGSYGEGDKVCALGAIARFLGWDGTYSNTLSLPSSFVATVIPDVSMRHKIVRLNDEEFRDFYEIADWLESQGF